MSADADEEASGGQSRPPVQANVIAFLAGARSHAGRPRSVDICETHGAMVFLAGDLAIKMKRAVHLPYLDFSTLEKRRAALEREFEINRPHAPEIYLGLSAITCDRSGRLAFDGPGTPVEWVLRMRRFEQSDLLLSRAREAPLGAEISRATADAVFAFHVAAAVASGADTAAQMQSIAIRISRTLGAAPAPEMREHASAFFRLSAEAIAKCKWVLSRRSRSGCVRRCHGDLHLGNVVLWKGQPVLFDAIEFDEAIGTIDTLYDLAFLLMDLDIEGQRPAANAVMNRYLWRSHSLLDLVGLGALPLFLALRAGVRAMVAADRARQVTDGEADASYARAGRYLAAALAHLDPAPPRLVAIGGLSGSGKSTLAAALAPDIGRSPGALHLRSDLERKAMAGVAETDRLPAESYTPASASAVYEQVIDKAKIALDAGQSVVVDAVFADPRERIAIEQTASLLSVPFVGLWLEAPGDVLVERVEGRRGDASDATASVVARQLAADPGAIGWHRIDAKDGPAVVLDRARKIRMSEGI